MKRRDFIISTGAVLAASPFMNFAKDKPLAKKMLVLGFDGMDPGIVKRLMGQGQLPNMQRLGQQGIFTMMRSTIPPQSPVAWGSFISGADPGVFGIFDFIHRNPDNYTPMFSQSETQPSSMLVNLGQYRIPLKPGKVVLKREGRAFWDYMEDRDIEATIFKVPTNYPPSASSQRTLAGMGTPDIQGTYGIYSLFTSDENESQSDISPNIPYYAYIDENNIMKDGQIEGPKNDLLKEGENVIVPFKVYVDKLHKTARIDIQGQEILIAEKEYSDWVEIEFSLINHIASIRGMVKFYLMEMGEKFRLYISPTHISPREPAMPICTPSSYSRELVDHVGLFHTIGLPADTKALSQGTFSMENYITQSLSVFGESCRLFDYELQRFSHQQEGLLFFYFSSLDQGQHMFWALNDKEHPYYHPEESRKFGYISDEMYRKFDRVLGKALKSIDPGIPVLVMSDHGFCPFHRAVNINNWLVREGYLKLSTSGDEEVSILEYADWPKSKAYALGLNGLYLNLKGREKEGAVNTVERRKLLEEIKAKLENLSDPKNGNKVISCAYISEDNFSKHFIGRAPDIILGFDRGYRISNNSALGTLDRETIMDNMDWWSGDHLVDPKKVPASFIANFKIQKPVPDIQDVAPTILKYFGIATPAQMTGKPLI